MHSEVMQATGNDHDQIRKAVLGVSQNIFHNSGTLDTRDRMFDFDPNFRNLTIGRFLFGSQLFLAWLFFG